MDLIPKALVVGVFAAVQPSPTPPVTTEKLNLIWAEVAPREGYRQLQLAPDGSAAQFFGETDADGATIQLPLIQVRSAIRMSASQAADEVQVVMKTIAKHLGINQFFNLGIKLVFHRPVSTNDATAFIIHGLLGKVDEHLAVLQRGGPAWTGVKYGLMGPDGSQYTLVIEPWLADPRYIFIDLDAQFPGPVELDKIKERAQEAEQYAVGPVKSYLDSGQSH